MLWCQQSDIAARYSVDLTQAPFNSTAVAAAIADASGIIEAHLASRYVIPASLATVPADLLRVACQIAFYLLLEYRGLQSTPESSDTNVYRKQYDDGVDYLVALQQEKVHPQLALLDSGIPNMTSSPEGCVATEGGITGAFGYNNRGW